MGNITASMTSTCICVYLYLQVYDTHRYTLPAGMSTGFIWVYAGYPHSFYALVYVGRYDLRILFRVSILISVVRDRGIRAVGAAYHVCCHWH